MLQLAPILLDKGAKIIKLVPLKISFNYKDITTIFDVDSKGMTNTEWALVKNLKEQFLSKNESLTPTMIL
jgi:hypothetical protein